MSYLDKYNRDNIHARAVIVGLINLLNQEVFIINTHSNERQDIVEVPFYYSNAGDERFMQDYFIEWRDCVHPKYLDGNFDPIPRGVVQLTDATLNTGSFTQRWIRGNFNRIVDGKIETYNAYINSLPIDMNFDVIVQVDTMTEAFKIQQAILEVFYRTQIFNTTFNGLMIPCQVGFPESYPINKTFEFTYPTDTKIEITFSLVLETYFPVIDEPNLGSNKAVNSANNKINEWLELDGTTNIRYNNKLSTDPNVRYLGDSPEQSGEDVTPNIGTVMGTSETTYYLGESRRNRINVRMGSDTKTIKDNMSAAGTSIRRASDRMYQVLIGKFESSKVSNESNITILSPKINEEYFSNDEMEIVWEYKGFIHKVNLFYSLDYGENWIEFKQLYPASHGSYKWTIPNFTDLIDVLVISSDKKGSGAQISAFVDINGEVYDAIVLNTGNNYSQLTNLEIESDTGSGAELIPSVVDGKIVDVVIRNPGSGYRVTKQVEMSIKIEGAGVNVENYLKDDNGNIGVILVK
ncbi:MAG TPA: hypothetical protein P5509_02555 [Bacteroidales bacterium]|nr:hypothetical protein [Bacteroidales bacterium]